MTLSNKNEILEQAQKRRVKNMKNLTRGEYIEMFLEYWNGFLTVSKFAEHKGMSENDAETIVKLGMAYANEDAGKS